MHINNLFQRLLKVDTKKIDCAYCREWTLIKYWVKIIGFCDKE
jgi:hypothetical protein